MNNVYKEQFEPWDDGKTVFVRSQYPTLGEVMSAVSANYEICKMINSGNWGFDI